MLNLSLTCWRARAKHVRQILRAALAFPMSAAVKTISRLKRDGMATARPYRGVFLTKSGQELAARVRARHRLVVDALVAMGVPVEAAEADAEGIEHYVSETTLRAFARFLRSRT